MASPRHLIDQASALLLLHLSRSFRGHGFRDRFRIAICDQSPFGNKTQGLIDDLTVSQHQRMSRPHDRKVGRTNQASTFHGHCAIIIPGQKRIPAGLVATPPGDHREFAFGSRQQWNQSCGICHQLSSARSGSCSNHNAPVQQVRQFSPLVWGADHDNSLDTRVKVLRKVRSCHKATHAVPND